MPLRLTVIFPVLLFAGHLVGCGFAPEQRDRWIANSTQTARVVADAVDETALEVDLGNGQTDTVETVLRTASTTLPALPIPHAGLIGAGLGLLGTFYGGWKRSQRNGWRAAATETAQGVGVWLAKASSHDARRLKESIKANQRTPQARQLIEQVRPVVAPTS